MNADLPSAEGCRQIANLLAVYAERVDRGDFDGVGELFTEAEYRMGGDRSAARRGAEVAATMKAVVILHGETPATKHVVTNPIIEFDIDARTGAPTATCRSYFTVTQATPDLPLQVIITGRYLDRFGCTEEGRWHFVERVIEVDQVGDLSQHLRRALP